MNCYAMNEKIQALINACENRHAEADEFQEELSLLLDVAGYGLHPCFGYAEAAVRSNQWAEARRFITIAWAGMAHRLINEQEAPPPRSKRARLQP